MAQISNVICLLYMHLCTACLKVPWEKVTYRGSISLHMVTRKKIKTAKEFIWLWSNFFDRISYLISYQRVFLWMLFLCALQRSIKMVRVAVKTARSALGWLAYRIHFEVHPTDECESAISSFHSVRWVNFSRDLSIFFQLIFHWSSQMWLN